jgi:hypothetical protein
MTELKPSDHGIVVEHKETDIRFAVSDRNYDSKVHRKVRDLRPGESVLTYAPRRKGSLGDAGSPAPTPGDAGDAAVGSGDSPDDTQTEGSAPAGTKGNR